jgi:hypothetical protein
MELYVPVIDCDACSSRGDLGFIDLRPVVVSTDFLKKDRFKLSQGFSDLKSSDWSRYIDVSVKK